MDAKKTHVLVLLAALSLVCTAVAWAVDHTVFSSVFAALGVVWRRSTKAPALTYGNVTSGQRVCATFPQHLPEKRASMPV
jgi:hypothetical protein